VKNREKISLGILLCAFFALSSCVVDDYLFTVSITNLSSKTVSYSFQGSTYTLSQNQHRYHNEVSSSTLRISEIVDDHGVKSVALSLDSFDNFSFRDLHRYDLTIINSSGSRVTLSEAHNYIEYNNPPVVTVVTIEANATINSNAYIYTRKPELTARMSVVGGRLFNTSYAIVDNLMTVTIRSN
jgi:hypothetical protein